ncbi:MAG: hypothetical protein R2706_17680 [Acidimicrobiales bacterium]
MKFDAAGMGAGTYSVTMAVSYYVGSERRTDEVVRQVTVGGAAP